MLTVTGTFQFLSVIPGFFFVLFSKEVEEGRVDKEESNTIDFLFFKTNDIYMCVYVCVCMCSVYYFVMIDLEDSVCGGAWCLGELCVPEDGSVCPGGGSVSWGFCVLGAAVCGYLWAVGGSVSLWGVSL